MDLKKFAKTKLPPLLLIALAVALDQWTKALVVEHLKPIYTLPIIEDIFHFTYATNRGAAFSMLADHPWVFMLVSTVAIIGMLVYLFIGKNLTALVRYPLAAVIGGGIGNMIDRVALGYVVDMFDLLLFEYPVFNLADCFVVVGAILGSIYYLWLYEKYDAPKKESSDGADDPASNK